MATGKKTSTKPQIMSGADVILSVLQEEGVEHLFGIPGGQVIPFFDRLYHRVQAGTLNYVLTRHEQGAAHMADGYARATGKVGCCIATSGPGALNLVTGLCTANMDSIPVLALTGQVRREAIGKDAFQEADIRGVTMPVTKHNYLLKEPVEVADVMREAFHLARSGRPGAVLVDVPSDIQLAECPLGERRQSVLRGYSVPEQGDPELVRQAAELINQARRPLLYVGGGVIASGASAVLRKLSAKAELPVVHTLMGKGAFPETSPLCLGMPGMHGTAYASHAMHGADLLIAVGVRFDDRVTGDVKKFAPNARAGIIHIDIDRAEIDKIVTPTVPLSGDARRVLEQLLPLVQKAAHPEWVKQLHAWKKKWPLHFHQPADTIAPEFVVQQLWEVTGGSAVVSTEVGQNQMWAAQYYLCDRPRQFLSSGGLGTMGYGFPAAIGAQFGCPDQVVWDIAGDGSIQMNIQELATAVIHKLPVKVAILNNGYLGMVRQWQQLFYGCRYSGVCLNGNPDFAAVAKAYGGEGYTVSRPEEVRPALERAMEINDRPVFVDFHVLEEQNVVPMIPAGKSVEELITEA